MIEIKIDGICQSDDLYSIYLYLLYVLVSKCRIHANQKVNLILTRHLHEQKN